ncbi:hypothetical protein C1I63_10315 [Rathayibacter caricis DSM 15933]|uniref:Uncharacterized protein n=1 Tax=Rathayibacter caricis DSM 15933 TaxID=1328867 RepID=A0A2T4UUL5_9MICO|nr:hypothetical protein [Rathayibacter caricis]PTL73201.1 hypothetical protein C1I63_10315 [Rathayibacter caricis DSM 15933]
MTSPEQESPHERQRPRHRRSEAEEDIAHLFRNRPDWEDDEYIARAVRNHPEAFAAFLQLPDVEVTSGSIATEFADIFYAVYDSLDEAIDDQIEILGWNEALTALQRDWGITPDELQWNYAAIERRFRATVDIVYYRDKVYTFHL